MVWDNELGPPSRLTYLYIQLFCRLLLPPILADFVKKMSLLRTDTNDMNFSGEGYSPIKMTGVFVVPLRGLNLRIGTAQGAKTQNDCCQSCLGKTLWQYFQNVIEKKVIFITIKICSAGYIICCCWIGTSWGWKWIWDTPIKQDSGTF